MAAADERRAILAAMLQATEERKTISTDVAAIKVSLKELNGTVKSNWRDIAVLQEKAQVSGVNRGHVINFVLGVIQAITVLWMASR